MLYSEAWPKGKFYNSAAPLLSNVADCMFAFYWFSGLQFYAFAPNQSTTSIKDRKRLSVQSCFKEYITWVCMIHRHVWSSAGSEESYDTTLLNKHFPDAESNAQLTQENLHRLEKKSYRKFCLILNLAHGKYRLVRCHDNSDNWDKANIVWCRGSQASW